MSAWSESLTCYFDLTRRSPFEVSKRGSYRTVLFRLLGINHLQNLVKPLLYLSPLFLFPHRTSLSCNTATSCSILTRIVHAEPANHFQRNPARPDRTPSLPLTQPPPAHRFKLRLILLASGGRGCRFCLPTTRSSTSTPRPPARRAASGCPAAVVGEWASQWRCWEVSGGENLAGEWGA